MRRVPVVPTIVVALAVATMIALGLWQLLDRRPQKLAFLERIERNPVLPPVAFPRAPDDAQLFRRSSAFCLPPVAITLAGAGGAGYRAIATCRTDAAGPGTVVQLGTTRDPAAHPTWTGGAVSGYISHAPDSRSLIGTLFHHEPPRMMLIADRPPLGISSKPQLSPNPAPNIDAIPNNHLAYAGQWFFFAAVASIIYAIALRHRGRTVVSPPTRG